MGFILFIGRVLSHIIAEAALVTLNLFYTCELSHRTRVKPMRFSTGTTNGMLSCKPMTAVFFRLIPKDSCQKCMSYGLRESRGLCPAGRKMSKPVLSQDPLLLHMQLSFLDRRNPCEADNPSLSSIDRTFYFFRFPARARMRRTFLGEIESRLATRAIFFPSFSHTLGITISANCSVSSWKVSSPVIPCDHARKSGSTLPRGMTFCRSICNSSHRSS